MTFTRIAVVNRGEAAMRLIHAVRDLNAELPPGQGTPIQVVALHTEGERRAMFVREADVAYNLGPASARPYLDHALLEKALLDTGADAVWVGWGFVAEDPAFAEVCARIGVTFIGPSPEAMRRLGDKIGSKLLAEEVGVPVAPWSRGPVESLEAAQAKAAEIGYPVMLKATAGGGGRGIRVIRSDADMADAYARTRDEAQRAFGNGVLFLESLVTGARHVEVQVIADGQGTAWALGVRDCSVQRRNQKVIEESASPVLSPEQTAELKASAERLALAVGYAGAGTVEFLYHPQGRFFAFLEVNTRLQVEHPITEVTTGTDLVKLQIHVAGGGRLEGHPPAERGHAVEARLNAEDPDRDFAPAPGRIALLALPAGPGIRVDTGVGEGDTIPADFDSMIAKIIASGRDRDEALARLRRAVGETTVVIEGGATNKSFILDLLGQPEVVDGSADTGWIDRVRGEGRLASAHHSGVALVAAGIEAYEDGEQVEVARLLETARGGRPQVQHKIGRAVDLKLRGEVHPVLVTRVGPQRFRVVIDGAEPLDAEIERIDEYASRLVLEGSRYRLLTATHGPVHLVEVDGTTHRVSRDEGGVVRSPAPALVVATPVPVGGTVAAGAPVLVLESMKMETVLPAPFAATVKELLVSTGSQVETGAPLMRLEPLPEQDADAAPDAAGAGAVDDEPPADLELPAPQVARSAAEEAAAELTDLSGMLLGYDLDPGDEGRTLAAYLASRETLTDEDAIPVDREVALLSLFADFAELSRNRPLGEDKHVENRVHSPREWFHTYLQTLDIERGVLPEEFKVRLMRVLRHYGVDSLDRSRELDDAVFRIFLAQQRSAPDVQLVMALLQRWISEPCPADPTLATTAREVLDRLVLATQLRFPIIGDLARSVRFRWFDQPLVDAERAAVLASVRDQVELLADNPDAPDRAERIDALAAIPEQIVRFLLDRLDRGMPEAEPMLEVLVRRHYREYELSGLRSTSSDGRPFAVADYLLDDRPTHLVTTVGSVSELVPGSALVDAVTRQVEEAAAGQESVVDLYLSWPEEPTSADDASAALRKLVGRARRRATGATHRDRRRRGSGARPGVLHLPAHRRRRRRRRRPGARRAPDGRASAQPLASAPVHPQAARGARGRPTLSRCGAAEPGRPTAHRARPGAPAQRGPRRAGAGDVAAARRARDLQLPGGGPPGAGIPRGAGCTPRHEPRVAARVAGDRGRARPADRPAEQHRPAHGGRRHRGDPRRRPGSGAERHGHAHLGAVLLPGGVGCDVPRRAAAPRPAQARRRLPAEGAPGPAPRHRLPLRDAGPRGRARRVVGRVRPRRHGPAGPCGPRTRPQPGGHHRGRRHHANGVASRRCSPGCPER